jgi:hypothetical protein
MLERGRVRGLRMEKQLKEGRREREGKANDKISMRHHHNCLASYQSVSQGSSACSLEASQGPICPFYLQPLPVHRSSFQARVLSTQKMAFCEEQRFKLIKILKAKFHPHVMRIFCCLLLLLLLKRQTHLELTYAKRFLCPCKYTSATNS